MHCPPMLPQVVTVVRYSGSNVNPKRVTYLNSLQRSIYHISLSCIIPVDYKIVLRQGSSTADILYELDQEVEKKMLTTLNGLVIDD